MLVAAAHRLVVKKAASTTALIHKVVATTSLTTTAMKLSFPLALFGASASMCGAFQQPQTSQAFTSTSTATFKPGDNIQVEVIQFGPLGASVEVIGLGHGDDVPLLPPDAPEPYGLGLIIQQEIKYFRESRNFVDVVRGEVLPAFVQNVREEDGKLDITLRSYGGKAKSTEVGAVILDRLKEMPDGRLNIGEKSSPAEINQEFPGVSKSVFKKALGGLYKKGLVKPGPKATELMSKS